MASHCAVVGDQTLILFAVSVMPTSLALSGEPLSGPKVIVGVATVVPVSDSSPDDRAR